MISKQEFQDWKHHPVSKIYLQFLKDKADYLKVEATERWLNGSQEFCQSNLTIRGQIIELSELYELPFEAIEAFYQTEEDNAAETTQDSTL